MPRIYPPASSAQLAPTPQLAQRTLLLDLAPATCRLRCGFLPATASPRLSCRQLALSFHCQGFPRLPVTQLGLGSAAPRLSPPASDSGAAARCLLHLPPQALASLPAQRAP
ncbi:hypothetical protein KIL84_007832 [Mauremys mutica]|uniref:Uncharacterized protein n=1 Tax=Mauremys mutica TaxID=74926 RepID=A0A9D4AW02_9SAUR|nr:hypothetical protein KIL84_007832 [Mauremys mutica]